MAAKVTALDASLAAHKAHLEQALSELAVASANGANVPALITHCITMATQVNHTLDTLKAWSDGEVSQSYVNSLLP